MRKDEIITNVRRMVSDAFEAQKVDFRRRHFDHHIGSKGVAYSPALSRWYFRYVLTI